MAQASKDRQVRGPVGNAIPGPLNQSSGHIVYVGSYLKLVGGLEQWVDLRENLQENIDFPMKNRIFLFFFPKTNQLINCFLFSWEFHRH